MLFLSLFFTISLSSCKSDKSEDAPAREKNAEYTKFKGSYKSFNDLNDIHLSVAVDKGIAPMQTYDDTTKLKDRLVRIPQDLDIYKTDKLTHSIPYLIPEAAQLLIKIGFNFRDSLLIKKLPPYKLVITSVTRSVDDNVRLSKRNTNVSQNSVHCYATTIDISWKRFVKKGPEGADDVSAERLKLVLAEVLHDLRQRDQCYVMYERKQACFHITVR